MAARWPTLESSAMYFSDAHEELRLHIRRFLEKEVAPSYERWERDGIVPHEVFAAAAFAARFERDWARSG